MAAGSFHEMPPPPVCEVCDRRPSIGVAAVPGVPYSAAFCRECLQANAIPLWIAVANTALIGGLGDAAPWWREVVTDTLTHLDVSWDDFEREVNQSIETEMRQQREDADTD